MQRKENTDTTIKKVKKGSSSKGASKKAYFASGPSILERNKRRRATRVARRTAYWKTVAGQARKLAKMSTSAKVKKLADWKQARSIRRSQNNS